MTTLLDRFISSALLLLFMVVLSMVIFLKSLKGNFVDKWNEVKDATVIYFNNTGTWFKAKAVSGVPFRLSSMCKRILAPRDRCISRCSAGG